MRKYSTKKLQKSFDRLSYILLSTRDEVLYDLKNKIEAELDRRGKKEFIKVTDKYLGTIGRKKIHFRKLEVTDNHYCEDMYGIFENDTNKLLRRHTNSNKLEKEYEYAVKCEM